MSERDPVLMNTTYTSFGEIIRRNIVGKTLDALTALSEGKQIDVEGVLTLDNFLLNLTKEVIEMRITYDDELLEVLSEEEIKERKPRNCAICGAIVFKSDKTCPQCGHTLSEYEI